MFSSSFFTSLVGRKIIMAVTGIILVGFVFVHMIGNLQVFLGPEAINSYGEFLHHMLHGGGIWIARSILLLAVALHIWSAASLTLESRAAKPERNKVQTWRESTYASRTMRFSGPILFLFIIYHLLHFTIGTVHPDFIAGDVYHNFTVGFRVGWVTFFYVVAMLALGFHMSHGIWSMFQTLGLSHPRWNGYRKLLAYGLTFLVVGGNIVMPVSVYVGWIK